MKDLMELRAVEEGEYIVANNATVRCTASHFGISKSTVHTDVTRKLRDIDLELYKKVRKVLEINKAQRHIRGGMATKIKYKGSHAK